MGNLLLVPRTGTGVGIGPILRLDSTSSSSNFLRLIDRVELRKTQIIQANFSRNVHISLKCQTFVVDFGH